ncbi:MAG: DUF4838 domain-containing protein [Clostridia bacterium]|nr:DUF4838 domain-containing protein [Clostridia bacterium]
MLKKKINKIIATVLAAFLSLFAFACKDNTKDENPQGESAAVRGTHERTVSETNVDLVNNGKTDYVIVIGENENNDAVLFAVDELRQNVFRATGANLETKKDTEITYSSDTKVLSLGENVLVAQAGVTYDKTELGASGYVVQTKGNSVFMVGGSGEGTLYAVYGWLKEQFNYEYYAVGEIYIDKDIQVEKLLNVNLKEKPDFAYRMSNYGEAWFDKTVARRSRINYPNNVWVDFNGTQYHTSFSIVPPEVYMEEHPDWYASSGEQLCFSRDPEGLAAVVVERLKEGFTQYPDRNIVTFTQQDHNSWCDCDLCLASYKKYGTDSAVYIKFVNKVAEQIEAWAKEAYPGREILIAMFAYQKTEEAPVVQTENGYAPADDSVRLRDNVALFYCPIYANYYYDFNAEENVKEASTLSQWNVLAKNLFTWIYGANFQLYLAPYNNFNSMQNNYRYLYDRGAKYIFDQHQFNQVNGTDWYRLKAYLSNNLQWKIDSDQTQLINNFFDNYYKDASVAMKRLFDAENTWFAYIAEHHGYTGSVSYTAKTLLKEELWPRGVLENWLAMIDDAYKAIEPLKTANPALHETLEARIKVESIAFRFMQIEMYSIEYQDQLDDMKEAFKQDCKELGITRYAELHPIEEYLDMM